MMNRELSPATLGCYQHQQLITHWPSGHMMLKMCESILFLLLYYLRQESFHFFFFQSESKNFLMIFLKLHKMHLIEY